MADLSLGGKIILGLILFSFTRSCIPPAAPIFESHGAPAVTATQIATFDTPHAGLRWFAAARALAWSPDGRLLAVAANGNLFVRETDNGAVRQLAVRPTAGDSAVLSFASNDLLIIAPAQPIMSVFSVFDARRNTQVADIPGAVVTYPQLNRAQQAAVSPDRHQVAAFTGGPRALSLYEAGDWHLIAHLEMPLGIGAMAYAPDSHRLAITTFPAVIALLDTDNGKEVLRFAVAGTPSLEEVRARTEQQLADLRAGRPAAQVRISSPQTLAFRPDGQALFVGAGIMGLGEKVQDEAKAAARILRLSDGATLAVLDAPPPLSQAAWEPHGRFVAFADSAKHVFIWKPGQSYLRITFADPVRALAISPDGRQLAVGTPNGATLYRIDEK